jgi:hypothetical protein
MELFIDYEEFPLTKVRTVRHTLYAIYAICHTRGLVVCRMSYGITDVTDRQYVLCTVPPAYIL